MSGQNEGGIEALFLLLWCSQVLFRQDDFAASVCNHAILHDLVFWVLKIHILNLSRMVTGFPGIDRTKL